MPPRHSNSRHVVQSVSAPALRYDGPHPDELRARRLLGRVSVSDAVAREMAGLAYAVSEKLERRI